MVTHVCIGSEAELDISLDVLTDLVVLHTSLLMRYATFVKVQIWVYMRFWVPYTTLPQIQNRLVLLQNRDIGKSCTCKAFLSGERQWSEVKGICCQIVSCKIGLHDFLRGEI